MFRKNSLSSHTNTALPPQGTDKTSKMKKIIVTLAVLLTTAIAALAQDAGAARQITTKEFNQLVADTRADEWAFKGQRPVVVDFFATWCGPCKKLSPILEKVAARYEGKVDVYKVDVDKESSLAGTFGITSIPTLLTVRADGQPQIRVGFLGEKELEELFESLLK